MAIASGCGFRADIKWDTKQIDAAMWFKGHVALFEISAGMVPDAAAHTGDPKKLRDALFRTLVRSESGGKPKDEAIGQVARDVKALLVGELKDHIPVQPVTRVYPVVVAIDARVRVPGLRFWFDKMFLDQMADAPESSRVAALAVLSLEDLETVEQLIREHHPSLRGTPRGLIRLLRDWELVRGKLPKSGVRASSWYQFVREIAEAGVNDRLKAEADRWWAEMKQIFKHTAADPDNTG
jgi:hypothetical protein